MINPISNLDSVPTQEFIACLLQGERLVFLHFLEARWSDTPFMKLEEQLIRLVDSLANVLDSLRSDKSPKWVAFSQLGNMFLQLRTVQMLPEHSVVAFM